jgi:hypothetical protein
LPESLFERVFWEKKKLRVTTVPSINDSLTDRVLGLRDFETLWGSIDKIETLMVKSKIATNFSGVEQHFSLQFIIKV